MPLNFSDLLAIFATKYFGVNGTIGKCTAKNLATGASNYFLQLNRALFSYYINPYDLYMFFI